MMRARRLILGGITCFALALSLPAGASAAVTVDPAFTIIYVKGDAEPNQIHLDCRSGFMSINGVPAAEGRVSCSDLEKLHVFGFGGDDAIAMTGFGDLGEEAGIFGEEYEEYGEEAPSLRVSGGDGNDSLSADGTMLVNGGAGDDTLNALSGPGGELESLSLLGPALVGGSGSDHLISRAFFSFMLGGSGNDRVQATGLFNFALGAGGADTISGGRGPDFLAGGDGPDKIVGKAQHDFLLGQAGPDEIFGGGAGDLLAGGTGRDRLRGGPGKDLEFERNVPVRRLLEAAEILESGDDEAVAFERFLRLAG